MKFGEFRKYISKIDRVSICSNHNYYRKKEKVMRILSMGLNKIKCHDERKGILV